MIGSAVEALLEKIKSGESLERADLRDLVLNHATLENVSLSRSDLEGVNFEGADLRQADLSCANLREAYMPGVDLERANLQKANLEGANLEGANLQLADLRHANLGGTFRWKDARTAPDSIETILEYPDFLVRYNTTFGTSAGNYLKFFGTRGVLDASRWSWTEPFQVSSEGSDEPDRIEPGTRLPSCREHAAHEELAGMSAQPKGAQCAY